jgi:hypothetical protein
MGSSLEFFQVREGCERKSLLTALFQMHIRASELSRRGLVGSFIGELKRVLPYGRMQMVVKNSGWDRDYRKAEVGYVSLPDHH